MASSTPAPSPLRSGLNLIRRLPPSSVLHSVQSLCHLSPGLSEEWLQRIDVPLTVAKDKAAGKSFLCCDYNRDGDSFRSPWSNTYDPPLSDGFTPSASLRDLEVRAGEVWEAYRDAYYTSTTAEAVTISSVYFWSLGDTDGSHPSHPFASCWLLKKVVSGGRGSWDSIHVVEVSPARDGATAAYKLTSSVLLSLGRGDADAAAIGKADLSGSLTRQSHSTLPLTAERHHIVNIGTLIEAMEGDMRGALDALYIAKSKEIISACHTVSAGGPAAPSGKGFVAELSAAVKKHGTVA